MEKKISVIIPCHNVELYIERCLASLEKQTIGLDVLEIILIDDASTDGTREVLYRFQEKHAESVKVISLDENIRQGGARNRGLEIASAPYIGFVDSDDWIEPDMYEKMYEKATTYDCDIVFCRNIRDDGTAKELVGSTGKEDCLFQIDTDEQREAFLTSNIIGVNVWDKLYKRELIFDNQLSFLERMAYEDIHWGAMFYFYAKRVYILEEKLYHYYINTQSTVLNRNQKYHFDFFRVNLKKMEEYDMRGAWARYKEGVEYDFLLTYYIAGVKLLAHRFDEVPYDVFYEMQETVRLLTPSYKKNRYVQKEKKEIYKLLFELIEQPLGQEEVDQMITMVRGIRL